MDTPRIRPILELRLDFFYLWYEINSEKVRVFSILCNSCRDEKIGKTAIMRLKHVKFGPSSSPHNITSWLSCKDELTLTWNFFGRFRY